MAAMTASSSPAENYRSRWYALLLLAALLPLTACQSRPPAPGSYRVMGKTYKTLKSSEGFYEVGYASWYGDKFHGRLTANGETYDMYGRTAAHKTLPLGTKVKVINLENGSEVTARINDRGPFVEGRIIDLTRTLADELGFINQGITRVRIETLDGTSFDDGRFTWQVGAFSVRDNAERLAGRLNREFGSTRVVTAVIDGDTFYRVQAGNYSSRNEAEADKVRLSAIEAHPWLVARD